MRLTHFWENGKGIRVIISISYILLIISFYNLGYLAGYDQTRPKVTIFSPNLTHFEPLKDISNQTVQEEGNLVASKSGTKVYFVWCSGANRIKPENKRYFKDLDEALKKGYKPASNCPGM